MRIRLLNTLLLALLLLAVSRLWLFLREPPPALPSIGAEAATPAPMATEGEPGAAVPEILPESYDVIVARDLFSPTRGVVPPAPTAGTAPAPKPQPVPKLTLSGVVIVDGEKTAFLQEGTQEARPRKVRENENFAGGVVKAIRPDGVTFLFAGSEINVPLRTPKEGAGTPLPRGLGAAAGAAQRSIPPVTQPRRLTPGGVQQGQLPIPGRPSSAVPRIPAIEQPEEPGDEVFEDEEFPEEFMPGEEEPGMMEEEDEE